MADEKYLAVKNWEKHQHNMGKRDWNRDYTDKDTHPAYSKLTLIQRGLLDGLQRLRGRLGENVPNDASYVSLALLIPVSDRPHVGRALVSLMAQGFLVPTNQQHGFSESHREEEKREEKKVETQPQQPPPTPIRPEPVFTAMDAAKVLCDFEHLNLSGNHNLELAKEVLTKAMLAWQVDALTAVDRVAENWRAYLTAKEPQKKQPAKWWLSDGSWNTVIVGSRPTRPLHLHERQKLKDMGVDMNLPTEKLFAILREEKPRVQ